MKKTHLILGVILVLMGLAWTLLLNGRQERVILKTFRTAVNALEKTAPEPALSAARRADIVAGIFVPNPDISPTVEEFSLKNRTEIRAEIFQARAAIDTLSIRVSNLAVQMHPNQILATLTGTARVTVAFQGQTETAEEPFEAQWNKTDEGWRISALSAVKTPPPIRD